MASTFRIHPAIGIARVGNSPNSFYVAPEVTGGPPIDCDADGYPIVKDGKEQPVSRFKDPQGRIRRQAARFRVYVYEDASADGREVKIDDVMEIVDQHSGQRRKVRIKDIQWTVCLANKKSSWYEFKETDGEHGYPAGHPLRNAGITHTEERQKLIIDPGPRSVWFHDEKQRTAVFTPTVGAVETFPPPLLPNSVTTLGELHCTQRDNTNRLLVLGGLGNSGSMLTGFGNRKIENYANNDGWFDDISDGQVAASLAYEELELDGEKPPAAWATGTIAVDDPAWVIVGYPRYPPEITDIVTMDDLVFDVAVHQFGYAPLIFGIAPFDGGDHPPTPRTDLTAWRTRAWWNPDYRPHFHRDIEPILTRPGNYSSVMDLDPTDGGDPHDTGPGGNLDLKELAIPPHAGETPEQRQHRRDMRLFVYGVFRKQGQENDLLAPPNPTRPDYYRLFAMPLLCGDNPLSNVAPSKFPRLTDTMRFLLHQWAEGRFINETSEAIDSGPLDKGEGRALDHGVLGNALGGAFCPGGEASWIMRRPAIYASAYRIRQASPMPGSLSQPARLPGGSPDTAASLRDRLEPGDITKYSGVPWQSDFNECSTQPIDITYRDWNVIDPNTTGDPVRPISRLTYWWPAHRPMIVNGAAWSPTPITNAGDLQMVTIWSERSFLVSVPDPGPFGVPFVLTEPPRPQS